MNKIKLIVISLLLILVIPLAFAVAPTINSPEDEDVTQWDSVTINWIVTDTDTASSTYEIFKNSVSVKNGTWTNATSIAYSAGSSWNQNTNYNFTINATDTTDNIQNTMYVKCGGISLGAIRTFVQFLPLIILAIVLSIVVGFLKGLT